MTGNTYETKIAIIGGGPAALSLISHLVRMHEPNSDTPMSVHVFEKSDEVGPGLPYSGRHEYYRLNLPNSAMKVDAGDKGGFVDWMGKNGYSPDQSFVPRYVFGDYLRHVAKKLKTDAAGSGIEVVYHTNSTVEDIYRRNSRLYVVKVAGGDTGDRVFDGVVLCTGHMLPESYPNLQDVSNYHLNPWDDQAFDSLQSNPNATIGVIGSRLTAIDIVARLKSMGHLGKIVFASRSGLLPSVLGPVKPYNLRHLTHGNFLKHTFNHTDRLPGPTLLKLFLAELSEAEDREITLETIQEESLSVSPLKRLTQEIEAAEKGPRAWQEVLFAIYPIMPSIWSMLSMEDREFFLKEVHSVLLTHLAAFPLENARMVQEMMQSGQLQVMAGVNEIVPQKDQQGFLFGFDNGSDVSTDVVFNGSGFGHDPRRDPLLSGMINEGCLLPHDLGGIRVDPNTLQAEGADGSSQAALYAVGESTRGACYATADMSQVSAQAGRVAKGLSELALGLSRNFNQSRAPRASLSSSLSTGGSGYGFFGFKSPVGGGTLTNLAVSALPKKNMSTSAAANSLLKGPAALAKLPKKAAALGVAAAMFGAGSTVACRQILSECRRPAQQPDASGPSSSQTPTPHLKK